MKNISTFVKNENWPAAFSCARKFFFGLSKDEKRTIEIAADCQDQSKRAFYATIGVNWQEAIEEAKSILVAKFGAIGSC